ncbi:MAG: hypothetical protein AAFU79_23725 [Myxococcota bacterium]
MRFPAAPALLFLASIGAACGDDALTRPTGLPILTYPAGREFTLTLIMDRCRQSCETYAPSECEVSVEASDRVVEVSPRVPFERTDGVACNENCSGAAVLAHCAVGALEAGAWTVEAANGGFRQAITLR